MAKWKVTLVNYLAENFVAPKKSFAGWLTKKMMASFNQERSADAVDGFVEPYLGKTVAEIGPGHGFATRRILEKLQPSKLHVIEISESFRQDLKHTFASEIESGTMQVHDEDAKNLSFLKDNSVDYVFAFNVIYFLTPLKEYLEEIHRIVVPGGQVLFGVSDTTIAYDSNVFVNTDWNICKQRLGEAGFEDVSISERRMESYRLIFAKKPQT